MLAAAILATGALLAPPADAPPVEKQVVVSIGADTLKGGIVTEIMWDGGLLLVQGVYADSDGRLKVDYFAVPSEGIALTPLAEPTAAAVKYWERKASRLSPTGLGRITSSSDSTMPMYGVSSLDQRLRDAHDMGGIQTRHLIRLETLILHERTSEVAPYDGETYSWSPPELNRIAYVDGKGDLWIARADGSAPRRLLRGNFTLPAWSDNGRMIAIAERRDRGRQWEISVIHLPDSLVRP